MSLLATNVAKWIKHLDTLTLTTLGKSKLAYSNFRQDMNFIVTIKSGIHISLNSHAA